MADAAERIPLPENFVEVLYRSHMLEHLDRAEDRQFLREANRVLAKNRISRIAVPDLKKLICEYVAHGDAGFFVERTLLTR